VLTHVVGSPQATEPRFIKSILSEAIYRMRRSASLAVSLAASAALAAAAVAGTADAHGLGHHSFRGPQPRLLPDTLVVSGTVYPRRGVNLTVGQNLPYLTGTDSAGNPVPPYAAAVADGQYPYVFNNDSADGSFAVNTPIDLWDVSLSGQPLSTVHVPTSEMTTSFSSKSELAINVSTNGQAVSFLGYNAPTGTFDASNSSTPGIPDATNPDVSGPFYRVAGALSSDGRWTFTDTNSYSGDNGRAAILNGQDDQLYTAGNSNNGSSSPILAGLVNGTGAQSFPESFLPQGDQSPVTASTIEPLGTFNIDHLPAYSTVTDKAGKDTNFRGLTESNNVVYYTKGSGSNGINTVYFVDTTGNACKGTGVGIPQAGAALPTPGVTYPMCVLSGFSTARAKSLTTTPGGKDTTGGYPFGIWFANADTLYVADEGSGDNTYDATTNTYPNADISGLAYPAGLQKWVFSTTTQKWTLAYTLENGLNLGQPYVAPGYPTGDNSSTGLPWAPATDGLRNISGHVNGNGTVTIYATTSTVSGGGDQGADPNKVVAITDQLAASTAGIEKFVTVRPATAGVRYGGVAVLPSDFGDNGQYGNEGDNGYGSYPHGFRR
jgi:hypothetical protein